MACLKSSISWCNVHALQPTISMSVTLKNDLSAEVFFKQLLDIGNGKIDFHKNTQLIKFPKNICNIDDLKNALIKNVFPIIHDNYRNHQSNGLTKIIDVYEIILKIQKKNIFFNFSFV